MQELRLVLIILGAAAIAALFLHGLWTSKKEKPTRFMGRSEDDRENIQVPPAFDEDGVDEVRIVKSPQPKSMERKEPELSLSDEPEIDALFPDKEELHVRAVKQSQMMQETTPAAKSTSTDIYSSTPHSSNFVARDDVQFTTEPHQSSMYSDAYHVEIESELPKINRPIQRPTSALDEQRSMAERNGSRRHFDASSESSYSAYEASEMENQHFQRERSRMMNQGVHYQDEDAYSDQAQYQGQGAIQSQEEYRDSYQTKDFEQDPAYSSQEQYQTKAPESTLNHQSQSADVMETEAVQLEKPEQEQKESMVFCISVQVRKNQEFRGKELVNCLQQQEMLFGEFDIFHRHSDRLGMGKILFSAANMFNPGSFPMENIHQFNTQGITFFMTLPCPGEPEQNFNLMLKTAQLVADSLGGDVRDHEHHLITPQRIDEYREQIRQYYAPA